MANFYIRISETINLESGREKYNTEVNIPGVNQVSKRKDTIATTGVGPGIEIISFSEDESTQTAGSFVKTDVKYLRITNIDKTNSVEIYVIPAIDDNIVHVLTPGQSLLLPSAILRTDDFDDYVDDSFTDGSFFTNFTHITSIKAKAIGNPCSIEYLIASS